MTMEPALESDLLKALALVEEGQYAEALNLFERIRSFTVDKSELCVLLLNEAKSLALLARFSEARSRLEQMNQLHADPGFRIYREYSDVNISLLEGQASALALAQAFLDRYSEQLTDPEYADMLYDLKLRIACELVNTRQFAAGIESLARFLPEAKEEDLGRVYLFQGIALDFLNRTEEAITNLNRALLCDPPKDILARAHYHLGILSAKVGSLAWARQHLEQAYELRSGLNIPIQDLYASLIRVCEQLGDPKEADRFRALSKSKS